MITNYICLVADLKVNDVITCMSMFVDSTCFSVSKFCLTICGAVPLGVIGMCGHAYA